MAKSDRIARGAAHPRSRVLLVALAVALAAACSDGESATPPTTTPEASRSSTATPAPGSTTSTDSSTTDSTSTSTSSTFTPDGQTPEEEIVARYIGYWDARFAANSGTPNPDDPALREFATGAQLDAVVAETRANLEQGLAFRPAQAPADIQTVDVIQVQGDGAVVQECVVTDGVIFRRDTGEIVDGEVYTQNVRGELQRVDGVWKVSSARLVQQWEGVSGCARAS